MTVDPSENVQKSPKAGHVSELRVFRDAPAFRDALDDLRELIRKAKRAYGKQKRAPEGEWERLHAEYERLEARRREKIADLRDFLSEEDFSYDRLGRLIEREARVLVDAIPAVVAGDVAYSSFMREYLAWRALVTEVWSVPGHVAKATVRSVIESVQWVAMDRLRDRVRGERREKRGYWRSPKVRKSDAIRKRERRASMSQEEKTASKAAQRARMARSRADRRLREELYEGLLD